MDSFQNLPELSRTFFKTDFWQNLMFLFQNESALSVLSDFKQSDYNHDYDHIQELNPWIIWNSLIRKEEELSDFLFFLCGKRFQLVIVIKNDSSEDKVDEFSEMISDSWKWPACFWIESEEKEKEKRKW